MGKTVTLNLLQKEVYSELSEVRFLGRALVLISVEICSMQASRSQVPVSYTHLTLPTTPYV